MAPSLHPLIDNGITPGDASLAGGKLRCLCAANPVEVTLASNVAHNQYVKSDLLRPPLRCLRSLESCPSPRGSAPEYRNRAKLTDIG